MDPEFTKADREKRFAMRLSLWIGFGMLLIKSLAFIITDSSAILSDAAESVIHVIAVAFAVYALYLSRKPADKEHRYGHAKISFISAGVEGGMIIIAAIFIIYEAIADWISGLYLKNLDTGLLLILAAFLINSALGLYLLFVGKKRHSIIIEANGKHVLTDAWTSLGVLVGVTLTWTTNWLPLDPICAIAVASHILLSGFKLVHRAFNGLMDVADPKITQTITRVLETARDEFGIDYHELRHLDTGDGQRIEMHLLFDDEMPIQEAHSIATVIEDRLHVVLPRNVEVSSHLEPKRSHAQQHAIHHRPSDDNIPDSQ